MSLSYRYRGNEVRETRKKYKKKINPSALLGKKIKEEKQLKKIIILYSDKNNKIKPPLPYSVLNPEINSLSPSLKSNGVPSTIASFPRGINSLFIGV